MTLKKLNLWAVAAFVQLLPLTAAAQYNSPGNFVQESPALNRSVRALGMGNAFIAVDGNPYSPFYNPAGLNDLEEGRFDILSPTLEISANSLDLLGDITDLVDDLDAANTDSAKVAVLDTFVRQRFGEFNALRLALDIIRYTRHNFAAGVLVEQRTAFAFRDQSLPRFDVLDITDVIFYAAIAHDFWDKLLQVGLTVKPMIRSSVKESINSATAINDEVDDVFQTLLFPHFGIGFDLGVKSKLNFPGLMKSDTYKKWHEYLNPAVALTWQDIGNTAYKFNLRSTDGTESGVEDPAKFQNAVAASPVDNEQSISAGASVSPKFGFVDTTIGLDFRDLNHDSSVLAKTHFGVEARLPKILALRAGYSQGFFSGGVGLDLWVVKLDLATYEEEVGVFSSQEGNRRYAATLNFGI